MHIPFFFTELAAPQTTCMHQFETAARDAASKCLPVFVAPTQMRFPIGGECVTCQPRVMVSGAPWGNTGRNCKTILLKLTGSNHLNVSISG